MLEQQFATLITSLTQARALVDGDVPVDLDGLDSEVDLLCRTALKDPAAKRLLPVMGEAIEALGALAKALVDQRERLATMNPLAPPRATARQAAAAYSQSGNGAPAGPVLIPPQGVSDPQNPESRTAHDQSPDAESSDTSDEDRNER